VAERHAALRVERGGGHGDGDGTARDVEDRATAPGGPAMRPPVGWYVVDTRTGRVGVVIGHVGPYVQLRPHGGGREWDAEPAALRRATTAERIGAATAYVNARSRGEVL
jgi:hypothetical protein